MTTQTISFKKISHAFIHSHKIIEHMNLNAAEYMLWAKMMTLPIKENAHNLKPSGKEFLQQVNSLTLEDYLILIREELKEA